MNINSIEYKALKVKVAKYFNISSDGIKSITNPMRNKKLGYIIVVLTDIRFKPTLLREVTNGFTVVN